METRTLKVEEIEAKNFTAKIEPPIQKACSNCGALLSIDEFADDYLYPDGTEVDLYVYCASCEHDNYVSVALCPLVLVVVDAETNE